jgi:hypothetical protein
LMEINEATGWPGIAWEHWLYALEVEELPCGMAQAVHRSSRDPIFVLEAAASKGLLF